MNKKFKFYCAFVATLLCASTSLAQRPSKSDHSVRQNENKNERPDRGFVRPPGLLDVQRLREQRPFSPLGEEFRTFNGAHNNLNNTRYGSIFVELTRIAPAAYGTNNSLARQGAASPRSISNVTCSQPWSELEERHLSDMVWQWGQFIDHDLDLTEFQKPQEFAPIKVPVGDPVFDPASTGNAIIPFNRSLHLRSHRQVVRQQLNEITAWIDASNVYGSDLNRADALRTFEDGLLKTSDGGQFGDLLPFDESGTQFMAGDIRAGEQAGLTAMHTLFMREHNRLAKEIKNSDPELSDEEVYQQARKKVFAICESITYNEWLPALLGPENLLPEYLGYDNKVNPNIANEFSTCGFRFGHTMLSNQLLRLDSNNKSDRARQYSVAKRLFRSNCHS